MKWIRKALTELRIVTYHRGFLPKKTVEKAFGDPGCRKEIVEKWEKSHPGAARKLAAMTDRAMASAPADETGRGKYITDLKYYYYAYGFYPYEFANYHLDSRTEEESRAFIPNMELAEKAYRMNDIKAMALFRDKGLTYKLFKDFFHRECILVESRKDFAAFQDYVSRHPVFVKKQINGSYGSSVKRVDATACMDQLQEMFDSIIREGKHIIEEVIVQSKELAAFNASSVNTVRCATILTRQGPEIAFSVLHTGRKGSFVSNEGAGGVQAGIDIATGELNTVWIDEKNRRYDAHPDSGVPYAGSRLPDWEGLVRTCKEAAVIAGGKGCRYVGWDMAHTAEYGWVMVEGNGSGQLVGIQTTTQKGIRTDFEALMSRI